MQVLAVVAAHLKNTCALAVSVVIFRESFLFLSTEVQTTHFPFWSSSGPFLFCCCSLSAINKNKAHKLTLPTLH